MKSYKVLFVGSPGSGKTSAIRTISDVDVIDTDAKVSDSTIKRKKTTTVGMDYGRLSLSEDCVLHLYGTPGQERFKFMWDLMVSDLANDAQALILLVDNTRNYPFRDIDYYLSEFWDYIVKRHLIIAVTRSDLCAEPTKAEYQNRLKEKGLFTPIIFIDARKTVDVMDLVISALNQEEGIDWTEVSHRVTSAEPITLNPTSDTPQLEEPHSISIIEAAMQSRGIKGVTHMDNNQKLIDTSNDQLECNDLFISLAKLAAAIQNQAPQLGPVRNISLHSPHKDSVSVFIESDQALGLQTLPALTHKQIRQQAEDLLQWSDDVKNTQKT
jgi:signal recognition particle receptor subunit beta